MAKSRLPDKITIAQLREMQNKAVITMGKKRLVYEEPIPEFKKIVDNIFSRPPISKNKKVINARKSEIGNVKFGSDLERYMYNRLKDCRIPFEFQKKIVLVKGFNYKGQKIRDITWTLDFEIKGMAVIVDTKGFATDVFKIKLKLFKRWVIDNGRIKPLIFLPRIRTECDAVLGKIIDIRDGIVR